MKKTGKFSTILVILVATLSLAACGSNSSSSDKKESGSSAIKATSSSKKVKKENSVLEATKRLAASSKSTGDIYVTGKLKVGEKQSLKPGIYDMTVTGGSGNVSGERKSVTTGMFINWIAGVPSADSSDPSKIRMILMEGDELELSDISKVNFTAVSEKVTESNQIGIGNYVVGRDIKAGKYKLSTNMKMDPEYSNLGWSLSIYNDDSGESRDQSLNPDSSDVAVDIKDGEILTTDFESTQDGVSADTAKLVFTPIK